MGDEGVRNRPENENESPTVRVLKGIRGTKAGETFYKRKSGSVVQKIRETNISGYWGNSGNPELNSSFTQQEKDKIKKTQEVLKSKPPVVVSARKLLHDFADKGYININGRKITSFEDLAEIAQI